MHCCLLRLELDVIGNKNTSYCRKTIMSEDVRVLASDICWNNGSQTVVRESLSGGTPATSAYLHIFAQTFNF